MEENIDWLFDDPLPCVGSTSGEPPLKTEVRCEAGFEKQLLDGTGVKAENCEKEEVQVKVEREEEANRMQCVCLTSPGGCGACVWRGDRPEGRRDGECAGLEGEQYYYKKRLKGTHHRIPYALLGRVPETGLGGFGSLGLAEGEQFKEWVGECKQEQVEDIEPGWGRWQVMKVEGGGEYGSASMGEEEGRGEVGREGVVQPLVSMEGCKVEVKVEYCEEVGVETLGEGEEGNIHLKARSEPCTAVGDGWSVYGTQWSEDSSAPVEMCEAKPCVLNQETTQLSPMEGRPCRPPRQQQNLEEQCTELIAGGDVHQESAEVSSSHSSVGRDGEDVRRFACPHCDYRSVRNGTLRRHVETVHEGARKHACPHCPYRAGEKGNLNVHIDLIHEGLRRHACSRCSYRAGTKSDLQKHIQIVHEGLRKYACPHCQYRTGWKGDLQCHIDTVHEGLRKYACPECQYRAGSNRNLQKHIKRRHEK